ncbi:MAG TPA: hypothetical protein EYN06_05450 [Myxococcales bacterium]|nr:hypothetical protein [Myxococcales bacterium]HIN85909.1 hypothetical protein [Myxococcales bacterium]
MLKSLTISLLIFAISGCASTLEQTTATEVSTHYLYYSDSKKTGIKGGLGELIVEVGPNPKKRAPVRYAETVSGGMGETWRATIWMALLAATATLDRDLDTIRVTVEAEGAVDGPSAGALMAAAVMAGLKNVPVLESATLTGTINPDHTVGPVSGIPEKVIAAIEMGKTRIGVPVGQIIARTVKSKKKVNVRALAESRGAYVVELHHIRDAYQLLTGQKLEQPTALKPSEMLLPPWAAEVFFRKATETLEDIEKAQKNLKEIIDRAPDPSFRRFRDILKTTFKKVQRHIAEGDAVSAIYLATSLQGNHFDLNSRLLTMLGTHLNRWEYIRKLLRGHHFTVAGLLDASIPQWKKYVPHDASEVPYAVDTFEAFIHAMREFAEASEVMNNNPTLKRLFEDKSYIPKTRAEQSIAVRGLGQFNKLVVDAQTNLMLGQAYLALGKAWLKLKRRQRKKPVGAALLDSLRKRYQRVADANLQYADTLLILPRSEMGKKPKSEIRKQLMSMDLDYRQAVVNRRLPALLDESLLNKRELTYANLSGAISSFFASASLISKRYSLGAVFSKDQSELVSVRNRAALVSMLKLADIEARQVGAKCRNTLGEIPIISLIEYDLGQRMLRDAKTNKNATPAQRSNATQHQIAALGHLWRSTTMGRLALHVHRKLEGQD